MPKGLDTQLCCKQGSKIQIQKVFMSLNVIFVNSSSQLKRLNLIFMKVSTSFECWGECYFRPPNLHKHEKSLILLLFWGDRHFSFGGKRTSIYCQRALMRNFVVNKVQKFKCKKFFYMVECYFCGLI